MISLIISTVDIVVITSYCTRVYVSHTGVEFGTSFSKVSTLNNYNVNVIVICMSLLAIGNFLQFAERLVVILVRSMGDG